MLDCPRSMVSGDLAVTLVTDPSRPVSGPTPKYRMLSSPKGSAPGGTRSHNSFEPKDLPPRNFFTSSVTSTVCVFLLVRSTSSNLKVFSGIVFPSKYFFRRAHNLIFGQGVKAQGNRSRLLIRMDSLQVLRNVGTQVLQSLGGTDLHALGPASAFLFTQIAYQGEIVARRVKPGDSCGTGVPALAAIRSQTSVFINYHVFEFFVVADYRRILRTRLLTLPLLLRTLGAHILNRLGQWQQIAEYPDPGELPVDYSIMIHGAGHFTVTATHAEIPARGDVAYPFRELQLFKTPTFLVLVWMPHIHLIHGQAPSRVCPRFIMT